MASTQIVQWSLAELRRRSRPGVRGCWLWRGYRQPNGYGTVTIRGNRAYVHRLAYELAYGPLDAGLVVHHDCKRRACVNPEHLRALTVEEHRELHRRR